MATQAIRNRGFLLVIQQDNYKWFGCIEFESKNRFAKEHQYNIHKCKIYETILFQLLNKKISIKLSTFIYYIMHYIHLK